MEGRSHIFLPVYYLPASPVHQPHLLFLAQWFSALVAQWITWELWKKMQCLGSLDQLLQNLRQWGLVIDNFLEGP